MPSVQFNSQIKVDFGEILQGLSKLELSDLEQFMAQVSTLVARKKAPSLSKKETELLKKINEGLPEKFQSRYVGLLTKSVNETLTDKEHKEALQMIPIIEKHRVDRLKHLIDLAAIWDTTVDEVMKRLGITPPPTIHA